MVSPDDPSKSAIAGRKTTSWPKGNDDFANASATASLATWDAGVRGCDVTSSICYHGFGGEIVPHMNVAQNEN